MLVLMSIGSRLFKSVSYLCENERFFGEQKGLIVRETEKFLKEDKFLAKTRQVYYDR